MNDLKFEFDELPLGCFTDHKGRDWAYAIHASGVAHIEYAGNGEWRVIRIEIDTYAPHEIAAGYDRGRADIDPSEMFFRTIECALKSEHSEDIAEHVTSALIEEAACAAETRAEYQRASLTSRLSIFSAYATLFCAAGLIITDLMGHI